MNPTSSLSFLSPLFTHQVWQFVDIVDNPANRPIFVHCKAGVGRTGALVACWRISHGVDPEAAIRAEGFYTLHGSLQQASFVRDFASRNSVRCCRLRPTPATGAEKVAAPPKVCDAPNLSECEVPYEGQSELSADEVMDADEEEDAQLAAAAEPEGGAGNGAAGGGRPATGRDSRGANGSSKAALPAPAPLPTPGVAGSDAASTLPPLPLWEPQSSALNFVEQPKPFSPHTAKAPLFLVRTDGFTCVRDKVKRGRVRGGLS